MPWVHRVLVRGRIEHENSLDDTLYLAEQGVSVGGDGTLEEFDEAAEQVGAATPHLGVLAHHPTSTSERLQDCRNVLRVEREKLVVSKAATKQCYCHR